MSQEHLASTGHLFYYQGVACSVRALEAADIRQLYPQPVVAAALAAYRPAYQHQEHLLQDWVERLEWLARLDPPVEREALVLHRRTGAPLGFLALSAIDIYNAKAEASVAFFHGQGSRATLEAIHWLLDAAFSSFPFHKLVFCVQPGNRRAIQLMDALAIPLEAVLRQELRGSHGQRSDLWRYALFRSDWHQSRARARLQRLAPLLSSPITGT